MMNSGNVTASRLLCQEFITSVYYSDCKKNANYSLLEFIAPLSFYFEKSSQQLVMVCNYISARNNTFYCIIPNLVCRHLLFKLVLLQSRDLAFAKKRKLISYYSKFHRYKRGSAKYFKHIRAFLSQNTIMWCQLRVNVIFSFLENVLNAEGKEIIISFLSWDNKSDYDDMKKRAIELNDRGYNL